MRLFIILLFTLLSFKGKAHNSELDSLRVVMNFTKEPVKKTLLLDALINLSQKTDSQQTLNYIFEMSKWVKEIEDDSLASVYKADCAIHFLNHGIYDQALSFLFEAKDYFSNNNIHQPLAAVENSIGAIYSRINQHEKAKDHFTNALRAFENTPINNSALYRRATYSIYNNIAVAYLDYSNNLDSAEYFYRKANKLLTDQDSQSLAALYHNLAFLFVKRENIDSAYHYATMAKQLRSISNDRVGFIRTNALLANIYMQKKDYNKGFDLAFETYTAAKTIDHKESMLNAVSLLSQGYEAKGQYKEALSYFREQMRLNRILKQDSIVGKLRYMESEYKFDKYLSELEIKNKEEKFQNRNRLLIIVFALILSVFAILYIMSSNKVIRLEKERLSIDLENKNKKLTSNVMHLMQNTELMKDIVGRIIKLKLQTKGEIQQELHSISFALEKNLKGDLWKEFDSHFNDVHLDFYKSITEAYPDLSPNERKICALLRLNMSSKEIAAIVGITVKSVEVMRVRIRKKLQLNNTDINLVTFLSEL
ncbi:MAG: tetratricopeptide repeat protein [Marinifilaceae bacterium]